MDFFDAGAAFMRQGKSRSTALSRFMVPELCRYRWVTLLGHIHVEQQVGSTGESSSGTIKRDRAVDRLFPCRMKLLRIEEVHQASFEKLPEDRVVLAQIGFDSCLKFGLAKEIRIDIAPAQL